MSENISSAFEKSHKKDQYHELPGPKALPFFGLGLELKKKGCSYLGELEQKFGPMLKFPMPGMRGILVSDYDIVQKILIQTERQYYKGKIYELVKPITGMGLVINQGPSWRARRRTLNPLFKEGAFNLDIGFEKNYPSFRKKLLEQKGADHSVLFSHATFQVLIDLFFSRASTYDFDLLGKAFNQIQTYLGEMFWSLLRYPLWVPTPLNLKTKEALRVINSEVRKVLRDSEDKGASEFVDQLKKAKDPETGEGLSDQDIADEIITFFIAGHDTTALTLTYTFYLLSQNKKVLKKAQDEVDRLEELNLETLKKCSYLKALLMESMRLLPAVYMINRTNKDWVELGSYQFAPETTFFISQYAIHRSSRYWDEPLEFKPERFLEEKAPKEFLPFGGGARMCIGNHLALGEALLFCGNILKDLEPTKETERIDLSAYLTAVTREPILMSWKNRR